MRFAYFIITLTLIAALVAPFYLKGPTGAPIMSWDKLVEDSTPEVLVNREAYRWQDEQGRWHFSDAPSEQGERFEIEHNITTMESKWAKEAMRAQSAGSAGGSGTKGAISDMLKGTDLSIPDVYSGSAIDKAKEAAALIEDRGTMLDELMQSGPKH